MLNLLIKKLKLKTLDNNLKHKKLIPNKNQKNLGNVKHFSPANREWVISNYNFVYNKHLSVKHQLASKILNSYFNISSFNIFRYKTIKINIINKIVTKLRKSLNNIIISNIDIKDKQDKVIINLSFFNKQARFLNNKLSMIIKSLKISNVVKSFEILNTIKSLKLITEENSISKRNYFINKSKHHKTSRHLIRHLLNKRKIIKNILMLHFLLWILKIYNINIVKLYKYKGSLKTLVIKYKGTKLYFASNSTKNLLPKIEELLLNIVKNKLNTINKINTKYIWLFYYFKIKYLNKLFNKYMIREMLLINYLYLTMINKYKFTKFIPQIKLILSNIFEKKIEFNMVDVKYIFMNTDILSQIILTKLKYRNYNLMKILQKSLKFRKISTNTYNNNVTTIQNDISLLCNNTINDITSNKLNIQKDTLASTPYKWIKGMKFEAKGRLNKRYTATKSIFRYKYRGNLKNIDAIKYGTSNMLRTGIKPNTQYSYNPSGRRVGAFGLKGWISTK